jgi:hypothetical protein
VAAIDGFREGLNPSCALPRKKAQPVPRDGTVIQYVDETSTGKNIVKTFAGLCRASRLY